MNQLKSMRITVSIDDKLLADAQRCTGEKQKSKLVHMALRTLIQDQVAERLIALGGTDPRAKAASRR